MDHDRGKREGVVFIAVIVISSSDSFTSAPLPLPGNDVLQLKGGREGEREGGKEGGREKGRKKGREGEE